VARSESTPAGDPSALAIAYLRDALESQARVSVSDGEFVVRSPQLNLIAGGPSHEDALAELVELAERQPH
jgi:hypothetical protein